MHAKGGPVKYLAYLSLHTLWIAPSMEFHHKVLKIWEWTIIQKNYLSAEYYTNWEYQHILPPGVFLGLGVLAHFELCQFFKCWIVLNIFYYIFWNKMSQNQTRKILNYIKSLCAELFLIFSNVYILRQNIPKSNKKIFGLYQVFTHNFLCQNGRMFIKIFVL